MSTLDTQSWWTITPRPSRFGWFRRRWRAAAILAALCVVQFLLFRAWLETFFGPIGPTFYYLGSALFLWWWAVPVGFIVARNLRVPNRTRGARVKAILGATLLTAVVPLALGGLNYASFWFFFVAWVVGLFYFP